MIYFILFLVFSILMGVCLFSYGHVRAMIFFDYETVKKEAPGLLRFPNFYLYLGVLFFTIATVAVMKGLGI